MGTKEEILVMKRLMDNHRREKDELVTKLISMSSNVLYGRSSILLSPLHVCVGFNSNVLESIFDHPLLQACVMMFERNDWGRPILNIAATLDHQSAFSLILNYYIKHKSFETQKHVIFEAAPIVFARNYPPIMAIFLAIVSDIGLEIQNNAGDTIAHMIARSANKDSQHFRSELIRLGFKPSEEFNHNRDFITTMVNDILHNPTLKGIKNKLGQTPLHLAMENNKRSMVMELLKDTNCTFDQIKGAANKLEVSDKVSYNYIIGHMYR